MVKTKCQRCQGIKLDGTRCRNKIACRIDCVKYCHLHSKGYQTETNEVCTKPAVRREDVRKSAKAPAKRKASPKSKSKAKPKAKKQ